MLKFHMFMVVWGESFIDAMVKLTIPTLLYDRNLPALAARHDCKMVFFTRAADEALIRQAPSVVRLAALMPVEYVIFDPVGAVDVYHAMSDAHYRGSVAARAAGARAIVLAPDGLFANGSLAKVGEYAEQGKVAVMVPGPRLVEETIVPLLLPRIESKPLSCRELVSLMREHLHPALRRNFINSPDFSSFPTFICWSLGAKGMIIRGLHLHPLMIDFSRVGGLDTLKESGATIDTTLLGRGVENRSDIHVETDSDNIFVCSHTPRQATYSVSCHERFRLELFHNVAYGPMFNDLNRFLFTKALKLHVGELDDDWRRLEERTAWIAEAIQKVPRAPVRNGLLRSPARIVRTAKERIQDLRARYTHTHPQY